MPCSMQHHMVCYLHVAHTFLCCVKAIQLSCFCSFLSKHQYGWLSSHFSQHSLQPPSCIVHAIQFKVDNDFADNIDWQCFSFEVHCTWKFLQVHIFVLWFSGNNYIYAAWFCKLKSCFTQLCFANHFWGFRSCILLSKYLVLLCEFRKGWLRWEEKLMFYYAARFLIFV